jgi:hypothetical protein
MGLLAKDRFKRAHMLLLLVGAQIFPLALRCAPVYSFTRASPGVTQQRGLEAVSPPVINSRER